METVYMLNAHTPGWRSSRSGHLLSVPQERPFMQESTKYYMSVCLCSWELAFPVGKLLVLSRSFVMTHTHLPC